MVEVCIVLGFMIFGPLVYQLGFVIFSVFCKWPLLLILPILGFFIWHLFEVCSAEPIPIDIDDELTVDIEPMTQAQRMGLDLSDLIRQNRKIADEKAQRQTISNLRAILRGEEWS